MQSFEDVRVHLSSKYPLNDNDPYVISFDIEVEGGRQQGMYLAELDAEENPRKYLRISTPIAPIGKLDPKKCLRFNWEQRVGYFALSDIEGTPYLHLCENRPFAGLNDAEVDHLVEELSTLADRLERAMSKGKDVV